MSNDVKRYKVWEADLVLPDDSEVVLASDYAALEAELAELRDKLDVMTHCADYYSEMLVKSSDECEKLAGLLRKVLATHDYHTDDGEHAADEAHAALAEVK